MWLLFLSTLSETGCKALYFIPVISLFPLRILFYCVVVDLSIYFYLIPCSFGSPRSHNTPAWEPAAILLRGGAEWKAATWSPGSHCCLGQPGCNWLTSCSTRLEGVWGALWRSPHGSPNVVIKKCNHNPLPVFWSHPRSGMWSFFSVLQHWGIPAETSLHPMEPDAVNGK